MGRAARVRGGEWDSRWDNRRVGQFGGEDESVTV